MMDVPKEIEKVISDEANKFAKNPPFELGIYSTHLHQDQFCFKEGAIFGYNLAQKELEEKDKEIVFLKGQVEMFFKMHYKKEQGKEEKWDLYKKCNNL